MKSEYIISLLIFIPVLFIQTTIMPLVSIGGIMPDLILIILVYYGITQGQIYGTVFGFIYGFLFDLITGSLLGSSMIPKIVAGFTAGYFSSENKRDQYLISFNFSLIILLCSLVDSTIYSFFSAVDLSLGIFIVFFQNSLLPSIYTAVLGLVLMIFYPKRKLF